MKGRKIFRYSLALLIATVFSFTAYFYRNVERFYRWPDLDFLHFKKV